MKYLYYNKLIRDIVVMDYISILRSIYIKKHDGKESYKINGNTNEKNY